MVWCDSRGIRVLSKVETGFDARYVALLPLGWGCRGRYVRLVEACVVTVSSRSDE